MEDLWRVMAQVAESLAYQIHSDVGQMYLKYTNEISLPGDLCEEEIS